MTGDPAQVGGEAHGSIAWSLFGHYHVPGMNWVIMAILLVTLLTLVAATGALIAPRRMRRIGLTFSTALVRAGPLLGLLAATMVLHQMAINQIDGDPRAFHGEQAVATGVATMSLMFGVCAGIVGVFLSTVLKLVGDRQVDRS